VILAARRVPHQVLLEAWPGEPRLLERLAGTPPTPADSWQRCTAWSTR
jgi:hypothetical protein